MQFKTLANAIGSAKLADSTIDTHRAGKVRAPAMVPGEAYAMRAWSTKGSDSDNPNRLVRFVGAGKDAQGPYLAKNPRIKDMGDDTFYFVQTWDNDAGEMSMLTIKQADACLVVGNSRVTFTAIATQPSMPALEREVIPEPVVEGEVKTGKTPKERVAKVEKQRKSSKTKVAEVTETPAEAVAGAEDAGAEVLPQATDAEADAVAEAAGDEVSHTETAA